MRDEPPIWPVRSRFRRVIALGLIAALSVLSSCGSSTDLDASLDYMRSFGFTGPEATLLFYLDTFCSASRADGPLALLETIKNAPDPALTYTEAQVVYLALEEGGFDCTPSNTDYQAPSDSR